jgi:hypothetical protein
MSIKIIPRNQGYKFKIKGIGCYFEDESMVSLFDCFVFFTHFEATVDGKPNSEAG